MIAVKAITRTKASQAGVTSYLAAGDCTSAASVGLVGIPAKAEDVRVEAIVAGTWTIRTCKYVGPDYRTLDYNRTGSAGRWGAAAATASTTGRWVSTRQSAAIVGCTGIEASATTICARQSSAIVGCTRVGASGATARIRARQSAAIVGCTRVGASGLAGRICARQRTAIVGCTRVGARVAAPATRRWWRWWWRWRRWRRWSVDNCYRS